MSGTRSSEMGQIKWPKGDILHHESGTTIIDWIPMKRYHCFYCDFTGSGMHDCDEEIKELKNNRVRCSCCGKALHCRLVEDDSPIVKGEKIMVAKYGPCKC